MVCDEVFDFHREKEVFQVENGKRGKVGRVPSGLLSHWRRIIGKLYLPCAFRASFQYLTLLQDSKLRMFCLECRQDGRIPLMELFRDGD